MFIYSLRASTIKFFGVLVLSVAMLVVLIVLIPTYEPVSEVSAFADGENVNYTGVKTNEKRIAFLKQFGWDVDSTPVEEKEIIIPSEFDTVMTDYNNLQKSQGLNLEKYRRKTVTKYTYNVTNYENYTGTIYANLLIYRGRVIGGDISTADVSGFSHGFSR